MPGGDLTQGEANSLIAMEKVVVGQVRLGHPRPGDKRAVDLESRDRRESFFLDLDRAMIKISKATYQNRGRKVVVLVRLDINGRPHRNPDHVWVPCPHIHIYRQGHGDAWAEPIDPERFGDTSDLVRTLHEFMAYCNIVEPPQFEQNLKGLF